MELFALIGLAVVVTIVAAPIMCIVLFSRMRRVEEQLAAIRAQLAGSPTPMAASAPAAAVTSDPVPVGALPPTAPPPEPQSAPQTTPSTVPAAAHQAASTPSSTPTPEPALQPAPRAEPVDMSARILAIGGAFFVIAATALFLALAISSGWLTRELQVLLTFIGGVALAGFGVWAYETDDVPQLRDSHQVAGIIAGLGFAVLQLGCLVGTQAYDLVDPAVGLLVSLLVGVATVAVAWRWDSTWLAGFGVVTGLAAPIIVGADPDTLALAFLTFAAVAAVAACTLRGWAWLTSAVLIVTGPQVATWVDAQTHGASHFVPSALVIVGWWALLVAGACAWQLRNSKSRVSSQSAVQLFAASGAAVGMLIIAVENSYNSSSTNAWYLTDQLPLVLLAFALVHVLIGIAFSLRWKEEGRALGILIASVGAGIAAGAVAVRFDGPATVAFWTVEFLLLLWVRLEFDDRRAGIVAGLFAALALVHTLLFDATPEQLLNPVNEFSVPFFSLVIVIVGAVLGYVLTVRVPDASEFGDALVAPKRIGRWSQIVAIISTWYLISLGIVWLLTPEAAADQYGFVTGEVSQSAQLALSLFWALSALLCVHQGIARSIDMIRHAGIGLFGIVAAKVLLLDTAQLESGYRVLSFLIVGLLLLGGGYVYARQKPRGES